LTPHFLEFCRIYCAHCLHINMKIRESYDGLLQCPRSYDGLVHCPRSYDGLVQCSRSYDGLVHCPRSYDDLVSVLEIMMA